MRVLPSFAAALPCLVLLASCVGAPSRPVPAPVPKPGSANGPTLPASPAPRPAVSQAAIAWIDRPVAPGVWTYRPATTGSSALFGPAGAAPRLTVRCDRAGRRILFARLGAGQGAMTIRTSYGAQPWPAIPATGAQPETVATRAASDGGLDQIAYSRGKFAVEVPGLEPLILPAWAEVARVIEDCRG